MEAEITKEPSASAVDVAEATVPNSTETFQSFIYELFEKNGILNDLRAYLRSHIVNALKSAQTGDPPACQKNFTERLEHTSQALNILVAEYLLRLDFNYSFSVFISEIPLANMVFSFAKNLMNKSYEEKMDLRFSDNDVWSILNYLGVQCDSEHAANIVEMYKNETQNPLLLCILKCMPMYKGIVQQVTSEESLSSTKSIQSIDIKKNLSVPDKCKHYVFCKTCQNRMLRIKDKYKKKKQHLGKKVKDGVVDLMNAENLINNINDMEKNLIDEMFQQLKSVYETEVTMVKVEEEKKVKRSMATHALQMRKKRDEMEELFRAREAELERSVEQKKRFLWGLARALRDQHQHMTRAMNDVREETHRLSAKENSLKTQLAEAEQILKKRGEEMRSQISDELRVLECHLESMKQERDNITRERSELEKIQISHESPSKVLKVHNMDDEHIYSHYDLLKNELAILKKYIESTTLAPKCVIERGTTTDPIETCSNLNLNMNNNTQSLDKCCKSDDVDDKVKNNLVVNDFKKKNVNFSQVSSKLDEIYRERSQERHSSGSSIVADTVDNVDEDLDHRSEERHLILKLREENERLKAYAREQRSHIAALTATRQRPRTAPPAATISGYTVNTTSSAHTVNVGWRKGAGEELSVFSNAQPRILVPGDTLPFIGVLRDRHGTARRSHSRPLTCQSRGRVRNLLAGISKRTVSPHRERLAIASGNSGLRLSTARVPLVQYSMQEQEDNAYQNLRERLQERPRPALSLEINRGREKSPKSVLREAKEKLRNKNTIKDNPPVIREKSPNSVLREAKMRLRKLEIEAEAVEQSYLDFRRKQSARLRRVDDKLPIAKDNKKTDIKQSQSLKKVEEKNRNETFVDLQKTMRSNFERYIREYKNTFDIGETHFRKKNSGAEKTKPIPVAYSGLASEKKTRSNYLEAPLTEFRKLYTSARQVQKDEDSKTLDSDTSVVGNKNELEYEHRHKTKEEKEAELEILKHNITKMYNLPIEQDCLEKCHSTEDTPRNEDENLLRVEVESVHEVNDIKSQAQDMLLVVQSSVTAGEVKVADSDIQGDVLSAQMTIIVSPKVTPRQYNDALSIQDRSRRSESPEQAAHLTRNDVLDAIFHAGPKNQISSVMDLSKDSISEYENQEYPDDRSDYDEQSPISLPKTLDDGNFWDS